MSISRRGLIGGLVGGTSLLLAEDGEASSQKRYPGHAGRYGLLHDTTLCVGCRSCEVACYEVNELAPLQAKWKRKDKRPAVDDDSVFDKVRGTSDLAYTVVNRHQEATATAPAVYRKHQCMHCNEPCCASVCFVNAFEKTPEGPVLYHADVCVGCRYCIMACPYDALAYEYDAPLTPRVVRCTMCLDRIRKGQDPGCADACPNGAITFGKREELLEVARDRIAKHPERYLNHVFGEHEFGGTSWLVLGGVALGKLGLPENASHEPLPALTEGALSLVPVIVSAWPGLLLGIYAFNKRKEKVSKAELAAALAAARTKADEAQSEALSVAAKKATKAKDQAVAQATKKAKADALKEAEAKATEAKS